jgi:NADH-quinone oxidoreductase subunit N
MEFFFQNNFSFMLPELYLFIFINFLIGISVFLLNLKNNVYESKLAIDLINLSILSLIFLQLLYVNSIEINFIILNYLFYSQGLSVFFKVLIITFTLIIFIITKSYIKNEKLYAFELSIIILLAMLGMLLMISSYDYLSMYLALELQSISLYILAAYKRVNLASTEAGLKYFILGAFSSGLFLFGFSMLYGFTGLTNFEDLVLVTAQPFQYNISEIMLAIVFILSGFLFKLSAAPFHVWTPDVYDGAPLLIVTFFALVTKIAALGMFIAFFYKALLNYLEIMQILLWFSGLLSLSIGTFGALYQIKLKRLYAYSTITHIGFFLIGLSLGSIEGLSAVLFYLLIYLVLGLLFFLVLLSVRYFFNSDKLVYISELINLPNGNLIVAVLLVLVLFSIAGVPPLMGFFSKFYLLLNVIKAEYYFLAFFLIIISVISTVYYIRLIVLLFFERKIRKETLFQDIGMELSLFFSYLSLINVLFIYNMNDLITLCHNLAFSFIYL